MTRKEIPAANLRQLPEDRVEGVGDDIDRMSREQLRCLARELQVREIELQLQNEKLRNAQLQLTQSHDRYVNLYDSAPVACLSLDTDSTILECNLMAARLLDDQRGRLVGHRLAPVLNRDSRDDLHRLLLAVAESGEQRACGLNLRRREGTVLPVWFEAALARGTAGTERQFRCTMFDRSEQARAEAALREADRRKDEFLAVLAHELRHPLVPISNALAILDHERASDSEKRAALQMVERQTRQLGRLVEDLLDISRVSRGELQLRHSQVELGALLAEVAEAAAPQIAEAGVKFSFVPPSSPVWVRADPVRLTQVFANLISNAVKFTGSSGLVTIGVGQHGTQALIEVTDSGLGIAAQDLPRLFAKFSRFGERGQGRAPGHGIGLWLSQDLVHLHGGRIEAASGGVGEGTRMSVYLPLSQQSQAATAATDVAESPPVRRRILVVDDDRAVADSSATLLRLHEQAVELAYDGAGAIAAAQRFHPDVVLLDIGLPLMEGNDTCRALRQLPGGDQMTIVAVTGWSDEENRRKSIAAGFDAYLVKPVVWDELQRIVSNCRGPGARVSNPLVASLPTPTAGRSS